MTVAGLRLVAIMASPAVAVFRLQSRPRPRPRSRSRGGRGGKGGETVLERGVLGCMLHRAEDIDEVSVSCAV